MNACLDCGVLLDGSDDPAVTHCYANPVGGHQRIKEASWLAGRTVVVDIDFAPDFDVSLVPIVEGLSEIQGPLINGAVAFTWQEVTATDDELVRRSYDLLRAAGGQ